MAIDSLETDPLREVSVIEEVSSREQKLLEIIDNLIQCSFNAMSQLESHTVIQKGYYGRIANSGIEKIIKSCQTTIAFADGFVREHFPERVTIEPEDNEF